MRRHVLIVVAFTIVIALVGVTPASASVPRLDKSGYRASAAAPAGWGKYNAAMSHVGSHTFSDEIVWDIALDKAGYIYTADASNGRVRKHNQAGRVVKTYMIKDVTCVFVDAAGYIWVGAGNTSNSTAFTNSAKLYKVNQAGSVVKSWSLGRVSPRDVATDKSGNLFIQWLTQDTSDPDDVYVDEAHLYRITAAGRGGYFGMNELNFPHGIACDAAGNVWVSDLYSDVTAIIKLTPSGTQAFGFAARGLKGTAFNEGSQMTIDKSGYVYMNMFGFDSDGNWIPKSGSVQKYRQNGQLVISKTVATGYVLQDGVAVDSIGYIYAGVSKE